MIKCLRRGCETFILDYGRGLVCNKHKALYKQEKEYHLYDKDEENPQQILETCNNELYLRQDRDMSLVRWNVWWIEPAEELF